jgi:thymidylate synthase ThyX
MISAKVVADSINKFGNRLTTLEVIMPRYILAEFNTHRMFSRNSASSRAIRFETMVKSIQENPFIPYAWQKDHSGMQGSEYFTIEEERENSLVGNWLMASTKAITAAKGLNSDGVTKQLCNRLLEPFMYHKVLVTATEWENFFELRCPQYNTPNGLFKTRNKAINNLQLPNSNKFQCPTYNDVLGWLQINQGQADIHMMFTAESIYDAINESTPKLLKEEEWHLPYGDVIDKDYLKQEFLSHNKDSLVTEDVINEAIRKISIVRCARVSYHIAGKEQAIDYKADLELYDRLVNSKHASPFEHIARNMTQEERNYHIKQEGDNIEYGWSRNFKGYLQYRELINL